MIRSVVKHRYFKGKDARKGLKRYINYLTYRDEHNLALNERIFFNKEKEAVHPLAVTKFIGRTENTVAGHELILSPGIQSVDARRYTKELMSKLEESLGVRLSWVAIAHKGKHNHIHVLIDGDTSGKRVRLGVEEYRRLREWGDGYLEREHRLERYLKREIDLDEPYKRDGGDCLFESLFTHAEKGGDRKEDHVVDRIDHFGGWDKARTIAELPDEEKIYEAGKVYCKFNTSAELASLENKLRISGNNLPDQQLKNLRRWIGDKEDFGDDHHERLARQEYARQKGRAQSKERLVSKTQETVNDSKDGVRQLMLQANDQIDSSTLVNEEAQWKLKEQQLDQQIQERRIEEDARLAQARQHEDKLWQANNRREEKFLETLVSESPDFREWAAEARRMREIQEQKRTDDRKAFDEKLAILRKEEEELRRLAMEKEREQENDERAAQERRDDERHAQEQRDDEETRVNENRLSDERADEDERLAQQQKEEEQLRDNEDKLAQERLERELENDERITQERRDEDERLAQLQKEDEEWRANEERLADERQEEDRVAELNRPDSKSQSEDDRARVSEYVVDETRKDQQLEIEQQQRGREYKLQNEHSVKQFQKECHSSLDKRSFGASDKGALRYERRPFKQRLHEDKGRQLQWHIRYQNSATRMMLNQQLEAEADASKKEQLRQQLDDLNKGEQEQLQTEIEPVDLDAIADEYLRPEIEEHPDSRHDFVESERSTDPDMLSKHWRSPLDIAQSKGERLKDVQASRGEANPVDQAVSEQSFNERIDSYAEEHWHEHSAKYAQERDELSDFLNMEDGRKMSKGYDVDKTIGRQNSDSSSCSNQTRQVFKSEPKRDDDLFSR